MIDQFRGCLLGLAVGDALGSPLDGLSTADIADKFGYVSELVGGGRRNLQPGEYTEATQQAQCLVESYLTVGGFDPQDMADRLLEWYITQPRLVDQITRQALANLAQGYHFERAGRDAWASVPGQAQLSSGSLIRAAPTGLVRYHDDIHLVGESRVISGITHADECCKLACVCLNMAIAHLLMVGADGLLEELLDFIGPRNKVLDTALKAIPSLNIQDLMGNGNAIDTLQCALWAAIYCTEFEEGLIVLVNRGGAPGVTGALGGALLGTRFGVGAIPEHWLNTLKECQLLDSHARSLFKLCQELE